MKWFMGLLVLFFACAAQAQFTNKSSVLDGSGTLASGGVFTNISASGQPGGITESWGGGFVNQAGFLNTFFMKPGLDTDGDGILDEADMDNDNDNLADGTELNGSGFSPTTVTLVNTRDSDGDGVLDGAEADAGTDPTDFNAAFEIVTITNAAGNRMVSWTGRGNSQRTYIVLRADSSATAPYLPVFTNTPSGGTSPWFLITNAVVDTTGTNAAFYAVRAQ